MKKKVLIWLFAIIVGLLAGIAVDYFVWGTPPLEHSIISLLVQSVVLFIIFFLFDRKNSKKKVQ